MGRFSSFKWSEKPGAGQDIVLRTSGRLLELEAGEAEVLYRSLVPSQDVPRVMDPSGGITTSFDVHDSPHLIPKTMKAAEECMCG